MGVRAARVLWLGLAVFVGLLVLGAASPALAGPADVDPGASAHGGAAAPDVRSIQDNETVEPPLSDYDELTTEYALEEDGSAVVTVEYRYRLDEGNQSVDWAELRAAIEDDPDAYIDRFRERRSEMTVIEENGEDDGMELSEFSVDVAETTGPPEYGQVRFTFHWSSFAHVEVNRIVVGEALEEFVMDERTQLVISWPDGYENRLIDPEPDDRRETAAIWYGDETKEFVDGEPRVEVMSGPDEPTDADGIPVPVIAGLGVLVLAALAVGGWWVTGREVGAEPEPSPAASESAEPATQPATPPRELLSNEERVLGLLEERGGRIKQQEVVSELGWTEAKTSQVVGGLREDGEIDVFRIGRENVLTLPEENPNGDGNGAASTDRAEGNGN